MSRDAIKHRARTGRLHRVRRGVYAVGRPELTREGRWMAAVLSCGDGAVLSHESAAALWGLESRERVITLSIPSPRQLRRKDVKVHRVELRPQDLRKHRGIPLTSPARTLIDLARYGVAATARARRQRGGPRATSSTPNGFAQPSPSGPGFAVRRHLRGLLDRRTFVLTDSELERRFLPLAKRAGLPLPETGCWIERLQGRLPLARASGSSSRPTGFATTGLPHSNDRDQPSATRLTPPSGLRTLRFTHSQFALRPGGGCVDPASSRSR